VKVVLDASALVAFIEEEPGGDVVAAHLAEAALSAVNYGEVLGRLVAKGSPPDHAARIVELLDLDIVDFDAKQGFISAALLPVTKPKGLSLGDRACLALGQTLNCPVLTADRAWSTLAIGVRVELIR